MTEMLALTTSLSPSFGKARRLSRLLAVIFTIGFWLRLCWLIYLPFHYWPKINDFAFDQIESALVRAPSVHIILMMLALSLSMVPSLFVLHHVGRLFADFARGEVFAPKPIGHIHAAGLWLMISAGTALLAPIALRLVFGPIFRTSFDDVVPNLLFGIVTTVAALVMAEARRIADDSASIV